MLNSILLQITTPHAIDSAVVDTATKAISQVSNMAAPEHTQDSLSLLDMVIKGGYIMIPLFVLFFIAIYVLIERSIVIRKAAKHDKNFMNTLRDFVLNGNMDAAKSFCKNTNSVQAKIAGRGLTRVGKPINEVKEAMEDIAKSEVYRLEKNMSILSVIGRIAPMFGFIGTILGVVKIFYDISLAGGDIRIDVISGGLYQKMITSAGGLVVGVIAFASYHILAIVIDKIVNRIETTAVEFTDMLQEPIK